MSRLSVRSRFAIVAVGIAIVSIPTSLVLFRPNPPSGATVPTSALPLLLGMKAFEGLALGTGIAFFVFGYPLLKRAGQQRQLTLMAYLAIGWCLVNWWPHDNLHLAIVPSNFWGQLPIEYAFHLPLMAAAAILAVFFYRVMLHAPAVGTVEFVARDKGATSEPDY